MALENVKGVLFWPFTSKQMGIVGRVVKGWVIALSTRFRKMDVWYESTAKWSQSPHGIAAAKRSVISNQTCFNQLKLKTE